MRGGAAGLTLFLLAMGLLGGACRPGEGPGLGTARVPPRSLVILCIDTLRADHVGVYGYGRDTTPRIDALAKQGAIFRFAVAQSDWTVPATASLLTSLYPSEHGAGIDGEVRLLSDRPPNQIRSGARTLAENLRQSAGLRTGLFSANPYLYGRFKAGFDTAVVARQGAASLTDAALAWLRATAPGPFFLYVQYMDLHQPIEPPEPYFDYFAVAEGGRRGKEHTDWSYGQQVDLEEPSFRRFRAHRLALYDGALRFVDAQIGRLLDELQRLGVAGSTLVVVTSDHGEEFWDHAAIERELGGDPRRQWGIGHGHSMFQELLHVPLVFEGPGVGAVGAIDCGMRQVDIVPTAMDLMGLQPPEGIRGRSLAPLVRPGSATQCTQVPLIAESPAYGPDSQALIWNQLKLVVRNDGVVLLYDLRRDPAEKVDLSKRHVGLVASLRLMLRHELAGAVPRGKAERPELDAETRQQLESLGYIR